MKTLKTALFLGLTIFLFAGCSGTIVQDKTPTATRTQYSSPTATPAPTNTLLPSPTATPQPTPTATPTPTPQSGGSEVISPENAAQVELLEWITYGSPWQFFDVVVDEERVGNAVETGGVLVGFSLQAEPFFQIPIQDWNSAIADQGRYMAQTSGTLYAVDVYDLSTGELAMTFDHLVNFPNARFHTNSWDGGFIQAMSFSADGSLLAVAYEDNTISVWDTRTGEEYSLPRTFDFTQQMAFSNDLQYLAVSFGWEGSLTVFDLSDLENIHLVLAKSNVGQLAANPFSPNGDYLLTVYDTLTSSKYGLFDLTTMTLVDMVRMPDGYSPQFSRNGDYVILGQSLAKELLTYEEITDPAVIREMLPSRSLHVPNKIFGLRKFYSARQMHVWDDSIGLLGTAFEVAPSTTNNHFWIGTNTYQAPASLLDGGVAYALTEEFVLYCAGGDLMQEILSSNEQIVLAEDCAGSGKVTYNPAKNVFAYQVGNRVEIRDLETGNLRLQVYGFFYPIKEIVFSTDGSRLMLYCDNPNEGLYSAEHDEVMLYSLDYDQQEWELLTLNLTREKYEDYISAAALSRDGNFLAVGAEGGILLWDFTDVVTRQKRWASPNNEVAFSPDSQVMAAAGGWNGNIYLYDTATSALLAEISVGGRTPVSQLIFSPDGKSLYVRSGDAVSVWGLP